MESIKTFNPRGWLLIMESLKEVNVPTELIVNLRKRNITTGSTVGTQNPTASYAPNITGSSQDLCKWISYTTTCLTPEALEA